MSENSSSAKIHELVPLLFVDDIARSAAFYRDAFRFVQTEQWEPNGKLAWCRMERGGTAIMLQQAAAEDGPAEHRGHGVGFFFNCDDVDALHAELQQTGLDLEPPTIAFYGLKQMFLKDLDGYELCFQSPARAG